jgi:hypothetical protein
MMYNGSGHSLPPQMIPLKKKDKKWKERTMDTLESIGRSQYNNNIYLVENYEMVKGKFIYSHYIEREDYNDLVTQLTREFDLPSHLRHYDIISQVINTLSGEYQKRPDIFRAKDYSEKSSNNYVRQKSELLVQYVMEELNRTITEKLVKEGLDPNRQDFSSEEEQVEYQNQVEERRQTMTPPEIEKYMNTKWMDQAEIWAEHQLNFDKQRFNLAEKEKVEFEDMLVSDRCFRHFYLTPDGYNQETWNPINTFFHKSPDVNYVEEGDYVGRVFYLTIPEIINRYGFLMKEEEILSLENYKQEQYDSDKMGGWGNGEYVGTIPDTIIPFKQYGEYKFVTDHLGFDPNNPDVTSNNNILMALGEGSVPVNTNAVFQVTEAYWMSQRKIGKFVYYDHETNAPMTMLVDEQFEIKGVEELENSFMELGDENRMNTITWTWVNQVWKGIKIGNISGNLLEPIYLDVKPNEFQFKGDMNIYGAKLPVCGQVFSNRNSESMSLVDLMKPHQIGYNVAMNQLYEIMQREIGRFMLMDINMIPSGKDWGGPGNYERFMLVAKQLGIGVVDASPANTKNSNFAHLQQVDLDESARMMSRLKIAEAFEQFALKQVGITPQRLGSIMASETATGTEQAVNQSYAQTESYFTNFSNYKRRCMQMNLDIAQYVAVNKDEIIISYLNSDMSRAFTKLLGSDLLVSEMGIMVVSSQEIQRQLETMRTLAIQNNTLFNNPVDVYAIVTTNSPAELKVQLETTYKNALKEQQAQRDHEQELAKQQGENAKAIQDAKLAWDADQKDKDRANERYIAEVKAVGAGTLGQGPDMDGSGIPDALEVQKYNLELDKHSEDIVLKRQEAQNKMAESRSKQELEKVKLESAERQQSKELEDREKDREVERENMQNDLQIAKIQAKNKPKSSK